MNKYLFLLLVHFCLALVAGPGGAKNTEVDATPFVGNTPAYRMSEAGLLRVARSNANILILGETGTGKDVLARRIHALSARAGNVFVPVNIAALPETLIDSELFGHLKGAFTGADTARVGVFESAKGGTLFLDELGEIPLPTQVRLLRALEDREIKPVGSNERRKIDIRVISATNLNLEQAVAEGKFREDLMYRVNTITIETVPLRERLEDIPGLVAYFLERRNRAELDGPKHFSSNALEFLARYPWPGNIRELKSVVDYAAVMSEGQEISHLNLPDKVLHVDPKPDVRLMLPFDFGPGRTLEQMLDAACLEVLKKHGGAYEQAAAELGISSKTLRIRVKRAEGSEP